MTPVVDPLYAITEVRQVSPSAAPILSAGHLTVTVVRQFDNACRRYFSVKDVAAADRVGKVIYNFESATIQSWISAQEAQLIALQFPKFLVSLKKKFLPRTWEDDLVQEQIVLQGPMNLLTWVSKVRNANDKLKVANSPYHIPDDRFRLHLLPRLSYGMK